MTMDISTEASRRRKVAERLGFFDVNAWLGDPEGFPLASGIQPQVFQDTVRSRCTQGALVSHWLGKTAGPGTGNQALVEIAHCLSDRDYTIWTGMPIGPDSEYPLPGLDSPEDRVRGVRVFPRSHAFAFCADCLGSLCEWLIEYRLPLFVWHVEIEWEELDALCATYPELSIVIETQTRKILYHTERLFNLMHKRPRVIIETSNFVGPGYIEYAVSEFGAARLLHGSFLPVNDPYVSMGMILDAEISEQDRAMIAGENARGLIREALQ